MSATMRAKMKLYSVTAYENGGGETLKFTAVSGGSPEDNSYSKFTPSGTIELFVSNPDLAGKLKPGETFYVDFTPADRANLLAE